MSYKRSAIGTVLLILFLVHAVTVAAQKETAASSDGSKQQVEISSLVELEWAQGTGDGRPQKLELLFKPELEAELQWDMNLTAIGRLRADAYDKLNPDEATDAELRELYIETTIGDTYLTFGKQQIVWGKTDGLKVLDIVNPQDFREFILDNFEESRIPLWAINAEIPLANAVVQLIWILDQTYDELPGDKALYQFTSPLVVPPLPEGVPLVLLPTEEPDRVFSDSDLGLRLSTQRAGWDLTLNYFYHYNDLPVFFREITSLPIGPQVTVTPRHERSHLLGGTFSTAHGHLTLRGEAGIFFDRFFSVNDLTDADGVAKIDELTYAVGLDWYGFNEMLLSFQLIQSRLNEDPPGLLRDDVETNLTFLLRRDFLNDSLITELLWLKNTNRGDGLIRPKITYELRDNIKLWFGADLFYGDNDGLFGQFDQNDRVVLGTELAF